MAGITGPAEPIQEGQECGAWRASMKGAGSQEGDAAEISRRGGLTEGGKSDHTEEKNVLKRVREQEKRYTREGWEQDRVV